MEWPMRMEENFTLGFQASFFQVISNEGFTLFNSNCGGGHRSVQCWFEVAKDGKECCLAFIRKGEVFIENNLLKKYDTSKETDF